MSIKRIIGLFLISPFFLFVGLSAQSDTTFSTPHATVYNHLFYLQADSYQPIKSSESFDLKIAEKDRRNLAVKLKQILDGQGLFVHMSKVPEKSDFTDSLSNKKLYYLFPEELPQVFVEFKKGRWQYGEETVQSINYLHKKTYPMGTSYLLKLVAGKSEKQFLGLNTWQYFGILALLLIGSIVFLILRLLLRPILRKIGNMSLHIPLENTKLLNRTTRVLSLLIVFILIKYIFPVLQLPVKWNMFIKKGLEIIITVFVALLVLRVMDYVVNYFRSLADRTESKMDNQLIPIVSQIFKLVVIIAASLQILHLVNVNITALIAGISIGGLALALAAKDTVGNLIGSLMIFLDKPFQIGDYIEIGSVGGTVVEVGFRSTRIQTKDTSIISIPNGSIANTTLINKGVRVFRLFETTLGVTYDTPPDLIEIFVQGLIQLANEHPKVAKEDYYIHMQGLGDSSLNVLFRVYLKTTSFAEEMALKEELLLTILKMAEKLGVRFAFPSTTVYIEQLPGQKDLIPSYNNTKEQNEEKLDDFINDWKKSNQVK